MSTNFLARVIRKTFTFYSDFHFANLLDCYHPFFRCPIPRHHFWRWWEGAHQIFINWWWRRFRHCRSIRRQNCCCGYQLTTGVAPRNLQWHATFSIWHRLQGTTVVEVAVVVVVGVWSPLLQTGSVCKKNHYPWYFFSDFCWLDF